ncbi:hypothetical protein K492DRAFT_172344 [Lichtheimia hyalospora FSU 10163]|nr:hypothetical protein K492DRAFT_172344 [Lichtheimia hyalospora FSU 10163]
MPPKPEIRRLLKQQRTERQKEKRVEHPFAKYNEQDQLVCVVCSQVVKSAWPAHLTSTVHKQSIARLKAVKQQQQQQSLKRSAPEEPNVSSHKRPRQEEQDDIMAEEEDEEDTNNQLPADFFDSAPVDANDDEEEKETTVQQQPQASSNDEDKHEVTHQMEHNLPQGFFDNPDDEARARRAPPPAEQLENRIEQDYADFQQLMADTALEADKAQDVEDEELWQDRDDDIFRQQAALDERVAKLKAMRERGVRPSAAMAVDDEQETTTVTESVAYDANEQAIRNQMKTRVRKLLQKSSNKAAQSIFDDMDESDEEEEEEEQDDWRAQQL